MEELGELFEDKKKITEKELINTFIEFIKQQKLTMFSLKIEIPCDREYPEYIHYFDEDTTITIEKRG